MKPELNDETGFTINIKWLIQIVVFVASSVWAYSEVSGRLTELEHRFEMIEEKLDRTNSEIEQSANGHNAWPMDVEQSTKIKRLEDDVRRIEDHYLNGK